MTCFYFRQLIYTQRDGNRDVREGESELEKVVYKYIYNIYLDILSSGLLLSLLSLLKFDIDPFLHGNEPFLGFTTPTADR